MGQPTQTWRDIFFLVLPVLGAAPLDLAGVFDAGFERLYRIEGGKDHHRGGGMSQYSISSAQGRKCQRHCSRKKGGGAASGPHTELFFLPRPRQEEQTPIMWNVCRKKELPDLTVHVELIIQWAGVWSQRRVGPRDLGNGDSWHYANCDNSGLLRMIHSNAWHSYIAIAMMLTRCHHTLDTSFYLYIEIRLLLVV